MADGAHRPIGANGVGKLRIDNTAPNLAIEQIRWRAQGVYMSRRTRTTRRSPASSSTPADEHRNRGSVAGEGLPLPQRRAQRFGLRRRQPRPDRPRLRFRRVAHNRRRQRSLPPRHLRVVPAAALQARTASWLMPGVAPLARAGDGGGPATNWLTNDDYSSNAVDVRVAIINV